MAKTKEEVTSKLNTIKDKVANTKDITPEKKAEAEAVIAQIEALNNQRTEEPVKETSKEQPIKEEPKVKTPKFKVKKPSEEPLKKTIVKATEEQLNVLVFAATSGICMALKKEDMKPDETKTFSSVLYEVGEQNGWWDKIEFLPYLILLGAGFELSMKIMNKPSKIPKRAIEQTVIERIEHKDEEMTNNDFGKVDMVDQNVLMKKLGANNIYNNEVTE